MCKRSSCFAAALVLLGFLSFSIQAQEPARTAAEPEVTTGAITGRVVNDRGEPLSGATVYARQIGAFIQSRTAIADAEGNFRINGLEPALYTVGGYAPAYVLQPTLADGSAAVYRIGDSVKVELVRGGVLTGTVTNAAGEPIVGIRVRVMRVKDADGRSPRPNTAVGGGDKPTDDRGIYRIYGLLPGTYLVFAGGGGGMQSSQLNPFENDVPTYSPSSTRDTATEYNVRSGEETTADIRYRSDAGRIVSGTVRLANPQSSASVMLFANDGSLVPVSSAVQTPGARGFALTGVGDGEYSIYGQEIQSFPVGATAPDLSITEVKKVIVKGADVTGVELTARPYGALSGTVVLEPSKAPECQGKR